MNASDDQIPPPQHPNCRCALTGPIGEQRSIGRRRPSAIVDNPFRELDLSVLRALAEIMNEKGER